MQQEKKNLLDTITEQLDEEKGHCRVRACLLFIFSFAAVCCRSHLMFVNNNGSSLHGIHEEYGLLFVLTENNQRCG